MIDRLRRLPAAGWLCALVALANALAWGLIAPPFQVPDENAHVAWTQYLAETGQPAKPVPGPLSQEQVALIDSVRFFRIIGRPASKPPWTKAEDAAVRGAEDAGLSRVGAGGALAATNNPPFFYILQSGVYLASPSDDLLDRMVLMRLLTALMLAGTALLSFLFVREVVPAAPWAWPAAGLAVAFQPLAGFLAGGVNNDNLLYLGSAATLYAMARILRRGLTVRRAAVLGAVVGLTLMTKWNYVGFLPGPAVAVLVALHRAWRGGHLRTGLRAAAVAAGVALLPALAYYLAIQTVWERPAVVGLGSVGRTANGAAYNLAAQVNYLWQSYLPRLPFMTDQIDGPLRLEDVWFNGFIGRFGWLDFGFEPVFYDYALALFLVMLALAVAALVRWRETLRARLGELAAYAAAMGGLLLLVGVFGYRYFITERMQFEQARYLLPLLPLYAALIALALKRLGPRWGPVGGAVVLVLVAGHSLAAQLVALGRWYG